MRRAVLIRQPSTDAGTFGKITLDDGTVFYTGELPDRNNDPGMSCIPPGVYECRWINSVKHGPCYEIFDVPGRTMIEIHPANWMGDKSKDYVSQLLGCIALGTGLGMLPPEGHAPQMALLRSSVAVDKFNANMKQADFELTIRWAE